MILLPLILYLASFVGTSISMWCSNSSVYVVDDVMVDNYVESWRGSGLGIILTAPHGGILKPDSIPKRDAGCWDEQNGACIWSHGCGVKDTRRCQAVSDIDEYTAELTREVRMNLCCYFKGLCPIAVISLLAREKHDPNRGMEEATFDVPRTIESYETYHDMISGSRDRVTSANPKKGGLLIDIHGHGHPAQRAEIGYIITGRQLDSGEYIDPSLSSIYSLANRSHNFEAVLRGNVSYGAYLDNYGFSSVPSPKVRGPDNMEYFNGGYTVRMHGSRNGGSVDAIQIESPRSYRLPAASKRYACALALSIAEFYCEHYTDGGATTRDCLSRADNQRVFGQCFDPSASSRAAYSFVNLSLLGAVVVSILGY